MTGWFILKIMPKKFNVIKNNSTTSKNFSFSKGVVSLNFTLRNDVKTELKDFSELLKVAQEEVLEELKKK